MVANVFVCLRLQPEGEREVGVSVCAASISVYLTAGSGQTTVRLPARPAQSHLYIHKHSVCFCGSGLQRVNVTVSAVLERWQREAQRGVEEPSVINVT